MPLTVITLTNTPKSLKGDLTKWMQEIATGVYIGNFNRKIREEIWKRVEESIGNGEATLSYYYRNEIGYDFKTLNTNRKVLDYEGIPLVLIPRKTDENNLKTGFSKAAKFRKANKYSGTKKVRPYVILDIETTGLDENKDEIIEIGALKISGNKVEEFNYLTRINKKVPEIITDLTGIRDKDLDNKGIDLKEALINLKEFIGNYGIVGYNINFDLAFINKYSEKLDIDVFGNKRYDLLQFIKKDNIFLSNFKLENVLKEYDIDQKVMHRALEDCKLIYRLCLEVNKFLDLIN